MKNYGYRLGTRGRADRVYRRTELQAPASGSSGSTPRRCRSAPASRRRWPTRSGMRCFGDETLNGLIRTALERNFDVRMAAERVQQARAQLGITQANQYPFIDAQAQFNAVRQSSLGSFRFVPVGTNLSATFTQLGAALTWEIDLWGRLRRLTEAARARYLATEEGRRGVNVALIADVTNAYFQLLEFELELEISRKTRDTRRKASASCNFGETKARHRVLTSDKPSS